MNGSRCYDNSVETKEQVSRVTFIHVSPLPRLEILPHSQMTPHNVRIILNFLVIVILISSICGQKYHRTKDPIEKFEKEIQLLEDIISDHEVGIINISSNCINSLKSLSIGSREGDESAIKCKLE